MSGGIFSWHLPCCSGGAPSDGQGSHLHPGDTPSHVESGRDKAGSVVVMAGVFPVISLCVL